MPDLIKVIHDLALENGRLKAELDQALLVIEWHGIQQRDEPDARDKTTPPHCITHQP